MEKQCRDRKRKEKEKREKVNRERVVDGLSPLAMPETTPEQDLLPSTSGDVDYSTLETPNTEATGGQSSGQRRAGTEPPVLAVGESTHVRMTDEARRPSVTRQESVGQYEPQEAARGNASWTLPQGKYFFAHFPAFSRHLCSR